MNAELPLFKNGNTTPKSVDYWPCHNPFKASSNPLDFIHKNASGVTTWPTCRRVIPVGTEELIMACFNKLKQFCLVSIRTTERWKSAQENISYHSQCPHVYLETITCNRNNITPQWLSVNRNIISQLVIGYLFQSSSVHSWTSAFLLTVSSLCDAIEGRLNHFLPRWLRMGWQSVISQGYSLILIVSIEDQYIKPSVTKYKYLWPVKPLRV